MPADKPTAHYFVDTNVWLYALIVNDDAQKHQVAAEIAQGGNVVVSTQVINETCVNLLRKANLSETQLCDLIVSFYAKYEVIATEAQALLRASRLRAQYSLSFWDSLVVASAIESGCNMLYTEDMQDGLTVEGQLTIINPFRTLA
jgi:predicted nucleic acid-binding protein